MTGAASQTTAPAVRFVSTHYRYLVTSTEWSGTNATKAWDGAGSPGDTDSAVDTLEDPEGHAAFAYGEHIEANLDEFVSGLRRTNASVHPCPVKPEKTQPTTIGHEPAILDEMHCPASGGAFVLTAFVIHAHNAYVFFTHTVGPGSEASTRSWFVSLLKDISFNL